MDAIHLQKTLKNIHEPKGYHFNRDTDKTRALLEALIFNRERYGYMACPCRLAREDKNADRDIICPCIYREEDVKESTGIRLGVDLWTAVQVNFQPDAVQMVDLAGYLVCCRIANGMEGIRDPEDNGRIPTIGSHRHDVAR